MPSNPTSPISRDEWSEHIAKWRTSELTRIEYCRHHGLQLNSFVYQINRSQEAKAKGLKLVPVKIQAAPPGGDVVLRGPRGWSLTMTSDVSTAWLGDLLGRLA
ncbi:MAG: IS66 family insertion sequence element accessory protein TnpA [Burkholderiales bacterium]